MPEQWQRFMPLEQLMAQEANPANPVVITTCIALSDNPSDEWFRTSFVPLILKHPRFSSRVVESSNGTFLFEPIPNFNPSYAAQNHLCIESCIEPSLPYAERYAEFSKRLSQIMSTDLDRSLPLWKLFIFPGWSILPESKPDKSSTVVVRVHHSIADGIGLVKYAIAEMVKTPSKPRNVLVVPNRQRRPRSCIQNVLGEPVIEHRGKNALHLPEPGILRRIYETLGDIYSCTVRIFFPEAESILTRSKVQTHKVCAMLPPSTFTVAMVKDAARIFGITINDLLYTALSGTVRTYLKEHGDNPNELEGLRCAVPFNGHMFDKYRMSDVSNQIAIVALPLHVDASSRLGRIRECVTTLRRMKRGIQPMLTAGLLSILSRLPQVIRRPVWRHLTRASSILFTNVPGPREVVSIGGVGVASIHFFAPADGHAGAVVGLFSYNGQLSLGVAGDQGRISDPHRFVDLFAEEIEALIDMSKEYS